MSEAATLDAEIRALEWDVLGKGDPPQAEAVEQAPPVELGEEERILIRGGVVWCLNRVCAYLRRGVRPDGDVDLLADGVRGVFAHYLPGVQLPQSPLSKLGASAAYVGGKILLSKKVDTNGPSDTSGAHGGHREVGEREDSPDREVDPEGLDGGPPVNPGPEGD